MPIVLYAEDDAEHRTMMRFMIRHTDITLVEAVNGEDAVQKVEDQHPDVVLLDLFMPKMDGFGVMEAIKSNPETADIPIVVLSAWPTGDNRKRAKEAGAVAFVSKPYDPMRLIELLEKYTSSQLRGVLAKASEEPKASLSG